MRAQTLQIVHGVTLFTNDLHVDVESRARASLNWSRTTFNRNCRRDLFLQIYEKLPSSAPAWPSSWPWVSLRLAYIVSGLFCPQLGVAHENVLRCRLQRPIHLSQTQLRQVPQPAFLHLVVPEVRDRCHFFLRLVPGSLQSQVPRLVCVCELANASDLQDRAPFVRQSYFDTLPLEVLTSSREQQCQNTQNNRSSHRISSSLPL